MSRRLRIDGEQVSTALDGLTLDVRPGSVVALSGPSGSGKSTLLHVIGAHRRRVGFVFQRFNLLPALTVADNVMAPVLPYRVGFDKEARAGERVAIARALINRPALVLADAPTGNLDSRTRAEVIDLLLGLRADHGVTIVLATHDPQVVRAAARGSSSPRRRSASSPAHRSRSGSRSGARSCGPSAATTTSRAPARFAQSVRAPQRPGAAELPVGLFGGISTAQWHEIEHLPGVQVAARIANLGYVLPTASIAIDVSNAAGSRGRVLLRGTLTCRGVT